jgi:hypothetical protein
MGPEMQMLAEGSANDDFLQTTNPIPADFGKFR